MSLTAEHPYFLLFLPLLLAGILYSAGWIKTKNRARKWTIIGLRIAVVLFVVLALAGINVGFSGKGATTVFVVDVSESVSGQVETSEQFVRDALMELPEKEKAAVVAFGADARIEQFVSDQPLFSGVETMPLVQATNLEKAVQTAMGLFEEESGKRLVILSDGKENEGELKKMAAAVAGSQVGVEIVKLKESDEAEAYVDQVKVPEWVDLNDSFPVEVKVESNVRTSAVLFLYSGSELKARQEVMLEKGENQFLFRDIQEAQGLKSYRVRLEAGQDTKVANNEYTAFTKARPGNKILLIEGEEGEGDIFTGILDAANIPYERRAAANAPAALQSLNQYPVVVMLDVYADDLKKGFTDNLKSYVGDYGGGLAVIGGENSFAMGNYRGTPLEEILPVYMDLKGEREVPETAIAMVIDRSGSMADGAAGRTMLDLAKEAAAESLKNLRAIDSVGVLAFESSCEWVAPLQKAEDLEKVEEQISSIGLGGGTNIYPALREAYEKLEDSTAKVKHIILLTDGQDGFRDYADLEAQLKEDKITLSAVAIGKEADAVLLQSLAEKGGGRFYYADENTDIPRIFAQEILLSAKTYLVNREFTPAAAGGSELLQGVMEEGIPLMSGYVASTRKERATPHLESDLGDPILTTWQYGIGKTAAFNSDGENKWTAQYANWSRYPWLWKNIIRYLTTDTGGEDSRASAVQEGSCVRLTYRTREDTAETKVSAVYTDEEGNRKELKLQATAPGIFEGEAEARQNGIYSVNIIRKENGTVTDTVNTAFAVQYSNEYRFMENDKTLENFSRASGGIFISKPGEVFRESIGKTGRTEPLKEYFLLLAALLFLADIINRRFTWRLPSPAYGKKEQAKARAKEQKPEEMKPEAYGRKANKPGKQKKEEKERELLDTKALLHKNGKQ